MWGGGINFIMFSCKYKHDVISNNHQRKCRKICDIRPISGLFICYDGLPAISLRKVMSNFLNFGFTSNKATKGVQHRKGKESSQKKYKAKIKPAFLPKWLKNYDDDASAAVFCKPCEIYANNQSSSFVTGCTTFHV